MSTSRMKAIPVSSLLGLERRSTPAELLVPSSSEGASHALDGTQKSGPGVRNGYRAEIDGLRAIAVVLVIFYHAEFQIAGWKVFGGGFIGVDVFFVISGYLIGSIILKDVASGTFSFINFYERRARRILPPLYVMLALSIPFAWLLLLPAAFSDWSLSLLGTVLSVSNLYFWHSGSYDTADNLIRPLIHTWSLGVEEQFYLFLPPFMVLMWKFARNRIGVVLLALCVLSAIFAEWLTQRSASASFFLLPSRVWELGVGVALAKRELDHGRVLSGRARFVMPLLGLALLLSAVLVTDPQWHHPGLLTLLPVAGTALLIWFTGTDDPLTRLLSSQPFVFVGLVSYSLYLWHQPIFAFGRLGTVGSIDALTMLGWIMLAFALAAATYFLVEGPARNRRRTSSRSIWLIALGGAGMLGAFGTYGYATQGMPSRFKGDLAPIAAASMKTEAEIVHDGKNCLDYVPERGPCTFSGSNADGFSLVSLGDSHARVLTGALRDQVAESTMMTSFTSLSRGGCVFILGVGQVNADQTSCPDEYNMQRLAYVTQMQRPIAVLVSRMPLLVEQSRFDNGEGGVEPGSDHPYLAASGTVGPAEPAVVASALSRTVHGLLDQGVKVVLVYPIPEMGWDIPQVSLVRALWKDDPTADLQAHPLSVSYERFLERTRRTYALYDRLGEHPDLLRVYPEKIFCDGDRCFGNEGSNLFYRDDDHLSSIGAAKLARSIMDEVQQRWGQ